MDLNPIRLHYQKQIRHKNNNQICASFTTLILNNFNKLFIIILNLY